MANIHPLVICGGNGTRLWPVSRTDSPKQFQRIGDDASLTFFQAAVDRHRGAGFEPPVIVSSVRHRNTVATQLAAIGCAATLIFEPMGRNTGPAVLAAALALYARDPQALMLVVPADHVIEGDINTTILSMRDAAVAGHIITFGIKPRYAETGFGYIVDGGVNPDFPGLHKVSRFVEKPPLRKARLLVESDVAYWASGISLFSVATIIAQYHRFDPDSFVAVQQALLHGATNDRGTLLNADHFRHAAAKPTEQVVFEKTRHIALAPLDVQWSDVGSWSAMYGISRPNPDGNVLQGDVIAVETRNSMVRSTTRLVSVVGVSDIIIIDTPDALLVTRVGHCQNVKKVAEHLKAAHRQEAEVHSADIAQWGSYKIMLDRNGLNLSTLVCNAGASIDIDPVRQREVTVISGAVLIGNGTTQTALGAGERALLDPRQVSRLSNRGDGPAELLVMTRSSDIALIDSIKEVPVAIAAAQVRADAPLRSLADTPVPHARPA